MVTNITYKKIFSNLSGIVVFILLLSAIVSTYAQTIVLDAALQASTIPNVAVAPVQPQYNQQVIVDKRLLIATLNLEKNYNFYPLGSNIWKAHLEVAIKAVDGSGNVLQTFPMDITIIPGTPERTLHIDYTAIETQVNHFESVVNNYNINDNNTLPGAVSETFVRTNIQLVLRKEDRLKYGTLNDAAASITIQQTAMQVIPGAANPSTEITQATFSWSLPGGTQQYFEKYDIELLKVEPDIFTRVIVDWSRAATIEVEISAPAATYTYTSTLSEGTGYYFWRVRPVGSYYEGGRANHKNYGEWSQHQANGAVTGLYISFSPQPVPAFVNDLNGSVPAVTVIGNFFFYHQFNNDINWTYGRVFTEGARQSETMTFANGLNQVNQVQTKLFSEQTLMATQTAYDFSGRPALQSLPAPASSNNNKLGYRPGFFQKSGGGLYTSFEFDLDNNIATNANATPRSIFNPEALVVNTTTGTPNHYYSSQNSASAYKYGNLVPDAKGFPYTRTLYYSDATGRVLQQGGPGQTMRLQANPAGHNVTTLFGSSSQDELDRIFGREAPLGSTVYKVVTIDPNKVSSVSYMAKAGQVLATALIDAGNPANLDDVGNEPSAPFATTNVFDRGTEVPGENYSKTSKTLTVDAANTIVTLDYTISPGSFALVCENNICWTCDYKVVFSIRFPQDPLDCSKNITFSFNITPQQLSSCFASQAPLTLGTSPLSSAEMIVSQPCTVLTTSLPLSVTLPEPGTYLLEKYVYVNNVAPNGMTYLEQYIEDLRADRAENWTAADNCNCPLDIDPPGEGYNCNDPVACSTATQISDFAQVLFSSFVTKEQNTSYKPKLAGSGASLLSNGFTVAVLVTIITDILNNTTGTYNLNCDDILNCFAAFGGYLDRNISLSTQTPVPSNFDPGFDYLKSVFNCMHYTYPNPGPGCEQYKTVIFNGVTGHNVAGNIRPWFLITNPATDNPADVAGVLDVEVPNPGGLSIAVYTTYSYTQVAKDQLVRNQVCLAAYPFPNSLGLSQAESAKKVCECLGSHDPSGGQTPDNLKDDMVKACEDRCETRALSYETLIESYKDNYNNAFNPDLTIDDLFDQSSVFGGNDAVKRCIVEGLVNKCKSQCYLATAFSLCSEDLPVNPCQANSYFSQTLGNEGFKQKMRDEQLAFQQAMLWNTELAPFKPSGGYSLFGEPLRVKKDVTYFIDTSLSNVLNYKVENCTLGCTAAIQYPLALHSGTNINSLPPTAFYKQQKFPFVLKIFNAGTGMYDNHSAVAVTNLVWEETSGSTTICNAPSGSISAIHEMNMGIYCDGNFTTPIVKWAYKPPTTCSFFTSPNVVQYDLRSQIVKFYTDIAGQLHAVMQPQACVSTGSVQVLNLTEKSYIASSSFMVLSGAANSNLMIEVGGDYLYDNPVKWNNTASATANAIVQAINGTYTTPNYYAEITGATVVIYASHITDENPVGFSVITSGTISVSTPGTMALLTTPLETVIANAPCAIVSDPMNGLCPYAMQKVEEAPFFNITEVDKIAGELFKFWNRTIEEAIVHREAFPVNPSPFLITGYPTSAYEYYQKTYRYFINPVFTNPNNKIGSPNMSLVTVIWDKTANKVIQAIDIRVIGGCDGTNPAQTQMHLQLKSFVPANGLFPSFLLPPAKPLMGCIMNDLITWAYNNVSGVITATITDANSNINSTTMILAGLNLTTPLGTVSSTPPFSTNVFNFNDGLGQAKCQAEAICEVCMRWVPPAQPDMELVSALAPTCQELEAAYTSNQVGTQLDDCLEDKIDEQITAYNNGCLNNINDKFSISYQLAYHHYTLYYYDRANNLIKTVPPEGVAFVNPVDVQTYRANPSNYTGSLSLIDPAHQMVTNYTYNSIKQLIDQTTPDGNFNMADNSVIPTRFWYNAVGQLVLSQDAQQAAVSVPPKYSYTKYDALGRIIEVGELGNFTPHGFDGTAFIPENPATFRPLVAELWTNKTFPDNVSGITKSEVVRTQYTIPEHNISCNGLVQRNLRNRVSKIYTDDGFATYFSYDPHGNVEWLVQELPEIGRKTLRYEYDLVSGNVKKVFFNEGTKEQFIRRFTYDEDNRIRDVFTSTDGLTWERETKYDYYLHGPLARMELGDDKVQGCDYVYTIEGYLKSKNQAGLAPSKDPGQDGVNATSSNAFARDEFASELGYYHGDYDRTGTFIGADNPLVDPYLIANSGGMTAAANDLFNGNISYRMSNIRSGNDPAKAGNPMEQKINIYRYDKLNRLKASDFKRFNTLSQWANDGFTYDEHFTYDANGNILTLKRFGYNNTVTTQSYGNAADNYLFDNMHYHYNTGTNRNNRLNYLDDFKSDNATPTASYGTDIGDQSSSNYRYDAEGNLVQDASEKLIITWNLINKVASVKKQVDVNGVPNYFYLLFEYDATGNRAIKKETEKTTNSGAAISSLRVIKATYYVRDASGNAMAIYEKEYDATDDETTYTLTELPIYGSSRVGEYKPQLVVATYNGYTDGSGGFLRKPTPSELTKWLIPTINGVKLADFSLSSTTTLGNVTDANGQTGIKYNTAVQQDEDGNFLFGAYTQSDNLWHFLNKNLGVMMQSGSFTASANSSMNASPVIVKDPSNASKYFFIYHTSGTGLQPLQYAVVDMAGDGGKGNLTMVAVPVDPSGVLLFGMGMAVVRHPDGSSRILAYTKSADDSKYLLYSIDIDNSGIHAPQLRATLPNSSTSQISHLNELAVSPDGRKVALTLKNSDSAPDIALWDYEPCCAIFSNPVLIQNDIFGLETVHAEFAHGSKYLYYVQTFFPSNASNLGRVNLSTNIPELVDFFGFNVSGADVQRGPDCRLYVNPGSGSHLWSVGNAEDEDLGKLQFNNTAISAGANLSTDLPRQPVSTDHTMSRIEAFAIPELSNWIAATMINSGTSGFVDVHFDGTTTPVVSNPLSTFAALSTLKNIAIAENEKGEIQFKYGVSYLFSGLGFAISNTGNTILSGNNLNFMKGDHRTPSIISKAPEGSPLYYIVTGLNGQMYSHTVNSEETFNGVQGKIMAVDQPLTISGGSPLTYDATLNQYALAAYNDVTIPTANRLYVAVNQRSAIRLYEFPVTQAGIGQGALVREYIDGFCLSFQAFFPPGPVQATCFIPPANLAQLYLCQMQISPAGNELSIALTQGGKGGLRNKIDRFSINPANSVSLSFLSAKVLSQEPRTNMAPNGDAKPLLRSRLMSFDYSPTAKYIYYVEKKYPVGTYNTRLMRFELATGVIEQVKEYKAAELETEVRRAEDGKLYMNMLPYSALSSTTPVSQLLSYGLLTTGTATAVAGSETVLALNSGHSNYGLPLQPLRRYARCETITCKATYSQRDIGKRLLELSDHLGNVMVVVSDRKLPVDVAPADGVVDYYSADVVQAQDYYPYHALMPGRSFNSTAYRFGGAGGQEKVDEISGSGNHNTALFWEYDTRTGRRWNLDPKPDAWESPYAAFANNPIRFSDILGDTEDERKKAVAKSKEFVSKNPGDTYKSGGFEDPGGCVDCSGLVRKSIIEGGLADPNATQNKGTGVKNIVAASTKVESINDIQEGNAAVIDWSGKQKGFGHIGLVTRVEKDDKGNVKSFDITDSGGEPGSGKSGPRTKTFDVGEGGDKFYNEKLITGFYKWDTPDKPALTNGNNNSVQESSNQNMFQQFVAPAATTNVVLPLVIPQTIKQ